MVYLFVCVLARSVVLCDICDSHRVNKKPQSSSGCCVLNVVPRDAIGVLRRADTLGYNLQDALPTGLNVL